MTKENHISIYKFNQKRQASLHYWTFACYPILVKLAADQPDDAVEIIILAGSIDADEEPKRTWRGLLVLALIAIFHAGCVL